MQQQSRFLPLAYHLLYVTISRLPSLYYCYYFLQRGAGHTLARGGAGYVATQPVKMSTLTAFGSTHRRKFNYFTLTGGPSVAVAEEVLDDHSVADDEDGVSTARGRVSSISSIARALNNTRVVSAASVHGKNAAAAVAAASLPHPSDGGAVGDVPSSYTDEEAEDRAQLLAEINSNPVVFSAAERARTLPLGDQLRVAMIATSFPVEEVRDALGYGGGSSGGGVGLTTPLTSRRFAMSRRGDGATFFGEFFSLALVRYEPPTEVQGGRHRSESTMKGAAGVGASARAARGVSGTPLTMGSVAPPSLPGPSAAAAVAAAAAAQSALPGQQNQQQHGAVADSFSLPMSAMTASPSLHGIRDPASSSSRGVIGNLLDRLSGAPKRLRCVGFDRGREFFACLLSPRSYCVRANIFPIYLDLVLAVVVTSHSRLTYRLREDCAVRVLSPPAVRSCWLPRVCIPSASWRATTLPA